MEWVDQMLDYLGHWNLTKEKNLELCALVMNSHVVALLVTSMPIDIANISTVFLHAKRLNYLSVLLVKS